MPILTLVSILLIKNERSGGAYSYTNID